MSFFATHTKKKNIVLLLGHPAGAGTLTAEFALLYEVAAKKAGHTVRRLNIHEMRFDPVLHQGYRAIQQLEPDLLEFQAVVRACDHLVIFYPNWWGSMPALLKGLFDRAWLPGFAFKYYKTGVRGHLHLWEKMLAGKTARVVVLSGVHPWLLLLSMGSYTKTISKSILSFAGIRARVTRLGPSERAPEWKKNEWRRHIIHLAKRGE